MPNHILFLAKLEGEGKFFLEGASIDLSSFIQLSFTYRDNVNFYKSVRHPLPTLPVGIGNTLAVFKANHSAPLSNEFPGTFSS